MWIGSNRLPAVNEFHGQIWDLFVRVRLWIESTVVDASNVLVLQREEGMHLRLKPGDGFFPCRQQQGRMDELHGYWPPGRTKVLLHLVDYSHPPCSQRLLQGEIAQVLPCADTVWVWRQSKV
jgi:hypothetical protein